MGGKGDAADDECWSSAVFGFDGLVVFRNYVADAGIRDSHGNLAGAAAAAGNLMVGFRVEVFFPGFANVPFMGEDKGYYSYAIRDLDWYRYARS